MSLKCHWPLAFFDLETRQYLQAKFPELQTAVFQQVDDSGKESNQSESDSSQTGYSFTRRRPTPVSNQWVTITRRRSASTSPPSHPAVNVRGCWRVAGCPNTFISDTKRVSREEEKKNPEGTRSELFFFKSEVEKKASQAVMLVVVMRPPEWLSVERADRSTLWRCKTFWGRYNLYVLPNSTTPKGCQKTLEFE